MKGQIDTYYVQVFEPASERNIGIQITKIRCFYNVEDLFGYISSLTAAHEKYSVWGAVCLLDRS